MLSLSLPLLPMPFLSRLSSRILIQRKKTMKDYMAIMRGLPHIRCDSTTAEDEIQKFVEKQLGDEFKDNIVGVSIAWNYSSCKDDVEKFLEKEMLARDEVYQKAKFAGHTAADREQKKLDDWQDTVEAKKPENLNKYAEAHNPVRRALVRLERKIGKGFEPEDPQEWSAEAQKQLLGNLHCSGEAFVVFQTEELRDQAVTENGTRDLGAFETGELKSQGTVTLATVVCEPDTIQWEHYGDSTPMKRFGRLLIGLGCILLALFFWTTVFYAPYAYQVFCFNYENGAVPPFSLAMTFCMVVVLGNAIMYEVCAQVSDFIGFKTRDDRESCYLILYVIACMFNVLLDMATTYYLSEYILDGLGFRTYHGVRFNDVPTFTERFETYAMQRMLAENTKAYSFPATFLIPFLIEPFVTVIVPYYLGKKMVRTHKEWCARDAELWMQAWEFDMGRYGDLLLDMVLGILIFFFPGGYTLLLFFGMAGSHVYIYAFDQWKVTQVIPKCVYANNKVDWWAQWMLAPITAMIVQALVFKANCQDYGYCLRGLPLIEVQFASFVGHTILHTLCLLYVVPLFRDRNIQPGPDNDKDFFQISAAEPSNWFSSNPVHCMRSKLIFEHDPPCSFAVLGKGHLQAYNKELGCCYKAEAAEKEDYSFTSSLRNMTKAKSKMDS